MGKCSSRFLADKLSWESYCGNWSAEQAFLRTFGKLEEFQQAALPRIVEGKNEDRAGARSDLDCGVWHRRGYLFAWHDPAGREFPVARQLPLEVLGSDADEEAVNFA